MKMDHELVSKKEDKRSGSKYAEKRKTRHRTFILCFLSFIMITCLSVALGSNLASAHDKSEQSEQKLYKSIEIAQGDTLWKIAKEYRGNHYNSIYDYIDEVKSINGLTSDQIHAGQYLTVVYYDMQ